MHGAERLHLAPLLAGHKHESQAMQTVGHTIFIQAVLAACGIAKTALHEIDVEERAIVTHEFVGMRCTPTLSTMAVDGEQIGYQAAKLLHSIMENGQASPVHVHVPAEYIPRGSG